MFTQLVVFCATLICFDGVNALDNGLALTPPMGWLTWERFRCNTDCENFPDLCIRNCKISTFNEPNGDIIELDSQHNERLIKEMANAMVTEGYADVGYEYVIIDDCWLTHDRAPDGSLVADPDRFPSGIRNLSDYVHNLGLKFGIYEDVGTGTCGGFPGSLNYFEQDAKLFAEWGVDYVKFDGCNIDPADFDMRYPEFGRYLNETGRPMVYSCEWPLYQNANGIKPNYSSIAATCNLWRNYYDIDDYYESFKNILNWHGDNQDMFSDFAGPGGWNDPDMIVVGDFALSYDQSKAQMASWAIMASPLIMSNDLRQMDPKMKELLQNKGVIQINQDRLAKQGRRVINNDGIQIWVKPILPVVGNDSSYAVAIISTKTDGAKYHLIQSLKSIGINNSQTYTVTEVFGALEEQELSSNDNLDLLINPTGALLFKLEIKN